MADNVLRARLQLKHDTINNWLNSSLILKDGEVAIATIPAQVTDAGLIPPAVGLKVGDGTKTFAQLDWIQAKAGDVYSWAKAQNKPSYTAGEITTTTSGSSVQDLLDTLSQAIISGDTNTQYRILTGTGADINKYFLQAKEKGQDDTHFSTVSTIDLTTLAAALLSIDADNITSGTLSVSHGGTGTTTLTQGQVVIGNGTNAVTTKAIDTAISTTNNDHLITSGAVKTYVDDEIAAATEGLTGAMHYIGTATVPIENGSSTDPQISGYDISEAQNGDTIVYQTKEFVWESNHWRLMGDEGSYAVKGSIVNADIAVNAAIDQSKINGLTSDLAAKADITSLDPIAFDGEVKNLKQTDNTILVLDCGDSTTIV